MGKVYNIEDWKEEAVVATVGFFDGVHIGHRYLLGEMRKLADKRGLPTAVITFAIHPRIVLHSDYQPKLLNSFDEKLELLSNTGVDYIIVVDFTLSLATLTAREFITDILSAKLHVKALVIGYDHRFGHLRTEGFEQYSAYGEECGMEVVKASSFADEGLAINFSMYRQQARDRLSINEEGNDGYAISSSTVRYLITSGNVAGASRALGYFYRLKGHVIYGHRVGREIGFPTANIAVDEKFKVIPLNGSYAVWIVIDDRRYKGMLYIGSRPTFEYDDSISIEVNIFDFSEDIYNKSVIVEFVEFIREDMKFDSLDDLRKQMREDKEKAIIELKTS